MKKKMTNILLLLPQIAIEVLYIWGIVMLIKESGFGGYTIMAIILSIVWVYYIKICYDNLEEYDRLHKEEFNNEKKEPLSKTSKIIKMVYITVIALLFFVFFILPFFNK